MTERDVEVTREHGGRPFEVEAPEGGDFQRALRRVATPTPTTASTTSSRTRCSGSSSTTSGTRATRRTSAATRSRRSSTATRSSTRTSRSAVLEEIADQESPVVMVHDYHLYTLPEIVRRENARRLPAPLHPHPVDAAGRLARAARRRCATEIYRGLLANDIVGFHTRSYRRNFLQCCRDLLDDVEVDMEAGVVRSATATRCGSAPTRCRSTTRRRAALGKRDAGQGVRERGPAPPARVLDPARRPRRPLQERPARLHRLRHLPRAAPRVRRAGHLHRPADAVADRRAGVRGVPRAHRGARRGRQPPPRHAGLDADPPQAARRPRRGGRLLQALRRDDGQRDVRRHEPRGEGGPAGQRARRRLDPVREHGRARGARRVRPLGQPVRRPGARRRDLRRADDGAGGARAARRRA